jgi:hypothetical protein
MHTRPRQFATARKTSALQGRAFRRGLQRSRYRNVSGSRPAAVGLTFNNMEHDMRVHLIASAILVAALAQGAYAQSSSSSTSSPSSQSAAQQTQSLPSEIKNKLTQDGFNDVTVVPGSFVVSAKDKHGDPVTMMIGPNSMTILTAVNPQNQQTTGSGSSSGSSSSSGMSGSSTNMNSSGSSNK